MASDVTTAPPPPPPQPHKAPPPADRAPAPARSRSALVALADQVRHFFTSYFWFILKNVIGWILMLSALPVGVALPGPGGLPIFLIGFALVTFPGKRRLTARVMRGRRMNLEDSIFTFVTAVTSLAVTGAIIWVLVARWGWTIEYYSIKPGSIVGICVLAAAVTWLTTRLSLKVVNLLVVSMPRARRYIRPWLRKRGVHILPPRHRRKLLASAAASAGLADKMAIGPDEEILEFHERHHRRLKSLWMASKPWLRRAVSLAITVAIVVWILKPIHQRWPEVREHIMAISPMRFVVASLMFSAFLFIFRALTWRQILIGFGHRLPVAPATRIWSLSELARYLPGSIWQVVGRVYLVKPYGVRGSVCSTSQVLELFTFLLANVLVAVVCLLYFGVRIDVDGSARVWLYTAMALVPALLIILHPRIFYGAANRILTRLRKPPIVQRLPGKAFVGLLLWTVLGLLWQSLAVWVITGQSLQLPLAKWWIVAGAYCLAWCAGFLAVWAPGGIGVREVVFMTVMLAAPLPPAVRQQFQDPKDLAAFLAFLSVLLRIWATLGEVMLAAASVGADWRGALGYDDAPGRVAASVLEPELEGVAGTGG